MTTNRFWEELSANCRPAFEQMVYDGWLLRFTPGYSTHNNSAWPLYPGELPLNEKIAYCQKRYMERGTSCSFRLADLPGHDTIGRMLAARGVLQRYYAIVRRDDEACAYGVATRQGAVLHVRDLWVKPHLRGRGIGTQLVQGLLQLGVSEGVHTATIEVNESNTGARRLYERLGFVVGYGYRYMEIG